MLPPILAAEHARFILVAGIETQIDSRGHPKELEARIGQAYRQSDFRVDAPIWLKLAPASVSGRYHR